MNEPPGALAYQGCWCFGQKDKQQPSVYQARLRACLLDDIEGLAAELKI